MSGRQRGTSLSNRTGLRSRLDQLELVVSQLEKSRRKITYRLWFRGEALPGSDVWTMNVGNIAMWRPRYDSPEVGPEGGSVPGPTEEPNDKL